jgi:hypothetical protein
MNINILKKNELNKKKTLLMLMWLQKDKYLERSALVLYMNFSTYRYPQVLRLDVAKQEYCVD